MQKLKQRLNKEGFEHNLLFRTDSAAIYSVYDGQRLVGYVVFQVRKRGDRRMGNRVLVSREIFPGKEDFGKWAWQFGSSQYHRAMEKYGKICCIEKIAA